MIEIKTIINKKIYVGITNDNRLAIEETEKELLPVLKLYAPNNEYIINSDSLIFEYKGDEDNYKAVKETIIVFLFIKGFQVVYLLEVDDENKFRKPKEYYLEYNDKLINKFVISNDDIKKNNIYNYEFDINDVLPYKIKKERRRQIFNIKEGDFAKLYELINNKSVERYIHLIEFYNYLPTSISKKIKFISLFIILESLANYYNDEHLGSIVEIDKKTELLKNYGDYNNKRNNKIFNNNPKDEMTNLYKIRNKIVHVGKLDEQIKKESEHLKKHSISELTSELTKYTVNSLKYDIKTYLDFKEE